MRTIAFMNQKGGVGKTTCAVNIGAGLARIGRKVLLVDIDPQANMTVHLDHDPSNTGNTIYEVLSGEKKLADAIHDVKGEKLKLVPSSIDLAGAEVEFANVIGREQLLRKALEDFASTGGDFEYILIDCPPSLGLLVLNALTAVHEVFIPVQAQYFALHGLSKIVDVVQLVQERLNSKLQVTGLIGCMVDSRTNLSNEVVDELRTHFGDKVFKTVIRRNVRLAEAPSHGKTIFAYDKYSAGTIDYTKLCRELRRKQKKEERKAGDETARIEIDGELGAAIEQAMAESKEDNIIPIDIDSRRFKRTDRFRKIADRPERFEAEVDAEPIKIDSDGDTEEHEGNISSLTEDDIRSAIGEMPTASPEGE